MIAITVCHHPTSLVVPFGDPQDGFFYPILTLMMDSYKLTQGLEFYKGLGKPRPWLKSPSPRRDISILHGHSGWIVYNPTWTLKWIVVYNPYGHSWLSVILSYMDTHGGLLYTLT